MREDRIEMSQEELKRAHIIRQRLEGHLIQREASIQLDLSVRQVRRLEERMREQGERGLAHGLRGRPSFRKILEKIRQKVLRIYEKDYYDFGPTLASEKLWERNRIQISDETLRQWLIEADLWKAKKRKRYRCWRERKARFGEMIQMDGSHHAWFEDRRKICTLMGYIDDATGKKRGWFYEYEGTQPAMDSLKRYIKRYGIPLSVYLDRHSTYKAWGKPTIEQQLKNEINLSQFERACKELSIQVIHAHSAPAKGRVERSFRTDQDRLVKELRLEGIKTLKKGNRFLNSYWPKHNQRFSIPARESVDMHRAVPKGMNLDSILCIKTPRVVRNDFTVSYEGQFYQILDPNVGKEVIIEEHTNLKTYLTYQGRRIAFKKVRRLPVKIKQPGRLRRYSKASIPSARHPWRRLTLTPKPLTQQAA
jgi:transposase